MSALGRLFARLRTGLDERADAPVGDHAQRILDVELRRADERLRQLRAELAAAKTAHAADGERLQATLAAIESREAQALAALAAGQHGLANELAALIAALEHQCRSDRTAVQRMDERIGQLRLDIEAHENTLRRLKHQLDALRASEGVQRARTVAAADAPASHALPRTALEAAQRLHARRSEQALVTTPTCDGHAGDALLDVPLQAAGVSGTDPQVTQVLERLQQQLPARARTAARRRDARIATDGLP